MHPGPMNRGVEIDSRVADGSHSVILAQVTNGVAVRMAALYLLAGGRPQLADAAKGAAGGGGGGGGGGPPLFGGGRGRRPRRAPAPTRGGATPQAKKPPPRPRPAG